MSLDNAGMLALVADNLRTNGRKEITAAASREVWEGQLAREGQASGYVVFDANGNLSAVDYASVAHAAAATMPSFRNSFRTSSYYAGVVGGGAVYQRVNTQPSHALWIQSADGAYWVYAETNGINVLAAGAKGDGAYDGDTGVITGTDDVVAIQNAIDAATYFGVGGGSVYLPGNRAYVISHGLEGGYGDAFRSTRILSDGAGYNADPGFRGAVLLKTYAGYGINMQGQRLGRVTGLACQGLNRKWIAVDAGPASSTGGVRTEANWVDPTILTSGVDSNGAAVAGSASGRYTPDCFIAIDARSGTAPATKYPDITYPSWTGISTQYGKALSVDVKIEDCQSAGNVVGFVNRPSDSDSNGDNMVVENCWVTYAQHAVSVCPTQSRSVALINLTVWNSFNAITTNTHGKQNGKLNGPIINLTTAHCMQWIKLHTSSIYGPLVFINPYGEDMFSIGTIASSTSAEEGIVFIAPYCGFTQQTDTNGVPAYVLKDTGGKPIAVHFEGGTFRNFPAVLGFGLGSDSLSFNGSKFNRQASPSNLYEKFAMNALAGGVVMARLGLQGNGQGGAGYFRVLHQFYDLDTGTLQLSPRMTGPGTRTKRAYCTPIYVESHSPYNGPRDYRSPLPPAVAAVSKASLSSFTITGKAAQIVFTSRTDQAYMYFGGLPGDPVWDDQTGTVWFIRARTTTTIDLVQQNNFVSDGLGDYAQIDAISTSVGNLYFGNSRLYAPEYPLQGDFASSSSTISNCGRADGFSGFLTTSTAVGDYIYVSDQIRRPMTPTNSLISARDNAAATITLGGNAIKTYADEPIRTLIRLPPANT
jgi:hypothetical protein